MMRLAGPGVLAATLLFLVGCGGDHAGHEDEDHAAHEAHEHHDEAHAGHDHVGLEATDGPGFTVADVRFMQMMIGHHAQALVMAEMAPTHGAGERLLLLAEKIEISQHDEIALMKRWLAERGQDVPDEAQIQAMRMPGLVSDEDLARLDAARGEEFDRLFLTLMIEHHVGAVQMVEELFDSPGAGQDSEIWAFANDVATDQLDEIGAMEAMLAELDTTPRSESR